ncbi:MAG: indole-3-glycerol phosphate synthase TrpC [Chloroflexota bacterium]
MTILDEILAHKREELATIRAALPLDEVRRMAADQPPARAFRQALEGSELAVIAEVKRRSPSAGVIRAQAEPAAVAAVYEAAGASAVSVLTDAQYFGGCADDLRAVRRRIGLPVLRKDFTLDAYQLWEARAMGADAILLIVRALPPSQLSDLIALAGELGMASLVEVHEEREADAAVAAGASIIGINNRDLGRMVTDLATTERLRPRIPPGQLVVSESGISSRAQVERVLAVGVDAVLVGEALMAAGDPAAALRALRSENST